MKLQAVSLFCDDVRKELQNKKTIVGTFNDRVQTAIPGRMPRLSIFTRVNIPNDWEGDGFSIVLRTTGKEDQLLSEIKISDILDARQRSIENGVPYVGVVLTTAISPYTIDDERLLTVILREAKTETVCGAMKLVRAVELEPKKATSKKRPKPKPKTEAESKPKPKPKLESKPKPNEKRRTTTSADAPAAVMGAPKRK